MKLELEEYLISEVINSYKTPREVIKEMLELKMIENPKQAWRTLEKFCDKEIYDYGVSLDKGWFVDGSFSVMRRRL